MARSCRFALSARDLLILLSETRSGAVIIISYDNIIFRKGLPSITITTRHSRNEDRVCPSAELEYSNVGGMFSFHSPDPALPCPALPRAASLPPPPPPPPHPALPVVLFGNILKHPPL